MKRSRPPARAENSFDDGLNIPACGAITGDFARRLLREPVLPLGVGAIWPVVERMDGESSLRVYAISELDPGIVAGISPEKWLAGSPR